MFYLMLTTNHLCIGFFYMLYGLIGGSFGYGLSLMLSMELTLPGFILCSSLQYNSIMTFHGLFMMFFMMMPILIGGFGNLLMPLLLCSSDMMFPSLNALSLWLVFSSLFFLLLSVFLEGGVNSGWTFYVPLSINNSSSIDLMFFSLHIVGLSSLLGSINFIITMLKATSFTILQSSLFMPLFPWCMFFTNILLLISLPVLAGCMTMIIFDSHFNTSFFDPLSGGDLILFQHLFWFFGHPEVYILIIPAFGMISEMLSKYCQCNIFGSDSMLIAIFIISFLGCMVWGHHLYIIGFDIITLSYFTTSTSIIAIPTGIKILNWLSTMWTGCFYLSTSLLFILGFIYSFSFGGLTGIILANCIIDTLLHDTYFVVGHFHYVLSLGAVYTMFSSFYMYFNYFNSMFYINEFLGIIHFIILFISSNIIFFSMHTLGIIGLPSSMFDYPIFYFKYNWLMSLGMFGIIISMFMFIIIMF